jgi:hypothetical protein
MIRSFLFLTNNLSSMLIDSHEKKEGQTRDLLLGLTLQGFRQFKC